MTRSTLATLAFLLATVFQAPAYADNLDYSVTGAAPASVKVCGDGTVFVDYANPTPGATYRFTLNVWVESGRAAAPFPTPAAPIEFMRLSRVDARSWFSAAPATVSFSGYGTDPVPGPRAPGYTGLPGGSYRAVTIALTIPAAGLPAGLIQVKVKARTAGLRCMGEAHGVIVRFAGAAAPVGGGRRGGGGGGGGGGDPALTLSTWLTDGAFVPLSEPQYGDAFRVLPQPGTLTVAGTVPGSFYLNLLATTSTRVPCMKVTVPALPADFALTGAGAIHAYVGGVEVPVPAPAGPATMCGKRPIEIVFRDLPAGTTVFVTVGLRYSLAVLPSATYLPRLYTFAAAATAGCKTLRAATSATGTLDLGGGDGGGGMAL